MAASLGCGVPTAVADLAAGQTVLDLGSRAGADVLISARRVGPSGRAIGIDMTEEMLVLARRNAAEAGATNVEFRLGYLEDLPLEDATVDVVISNCVINLAADKSVVLAEVARVLRPGGQFAVSDVSADVVVTMGCGDACPVYLGKRYLDRDLDDPHGRNVERVRQIRDDIDARVQDLLTQLAPVAR